MNKKIANLLSILLLNIISACNSGANYASQKLVVAHSQNKTSSGELKSKIENLNPSTDTLVDKLVLIEELNELTKFAQDLQISIGTAIKYGYFGYDSEVLSLLVNKVIPKITDKTAKEMIVQSKKYGQLDIKMLRAGGNPQLISGSGSTLILDRGYLEPAWSTSDGRFIFSEVRAGVKPLALVGTKRQILQYLTKSEDKIEMSDKLYGELGNTAGIYISDTKYSPAERYGMVFSPWDIGANLILEVIGNFGEDPLKEYIGAGEAYFCPSLETIITFLDAKTFISENSADTEVLDEFAKTDSDIHYVQFSYLKQTGFQKISDNNNSNCTDKQCSLNAIAKILDSNKKCFR